MSAVPPKRSLRGLENHRDEDGGGRRSRAERRATPLAAGVVVECDRVLVDAMSARSEPEDGPRELGDQ